MKEHEEYNVMLNSLIAFVSENDLKTDFTNPMTLYNKWIYQKGFMVKYPINAIRLCSFIQNSLTKSLDFAQYLKF